MAATLDAAHRADDAAPRSEADNIYLVPDRRRRRASRPSCSTSSCAARRATPRCWARCSGRRCTCRWNWCRSTARSTRAANIYALGCITELLTGRAPFEGPIYLVTDATCASGRRRELVAPEIRGARRARRRRCSKNPTGPRTRWRRWRARSRTCSRSAGPAAARIGRPSRRWPTLRAATARGARGPAGARWQPSRRAPADVRDVRARAIVVVAARHARAARGDRPGARAGGRALDDGGAAPRRRAADVSQGRLACPRRSTCRRGTMISVQNRNRWRGGNVGAAVSRWARDAGARRPGPHRHQAGLAEGVGSIAQCGPWEGFNAHRAWRRTSRRRWRARA